MHENRLSKTDSEENEIRLLIKPHFSSKICAISEDFFFSHVIFSKNFYQKDPGFGQEQEADRQSV
jgi:hypothetical protein